MEKTTKTNTVFKTLSAIDCRDKTEKRNGLTYRLWWHETHKPVKLHNAVGVPTIGVC